MHEKAIDGVIPEAGDQQKPLCAVRGAIRPGAMCGSVIVGMKLCGAKPGTCPHQREQTPAGVSASDSKTDRAALSAVPPTVKE